MLTIASTGFVGKSPVSPDANSVLQARTSTNLSLVGTVTQNDDTVTLSSAAQVAASPATSSTTADAYSGMSFAQLQVVNARVNQELSTGMWASAATNDSQLPDPATPDTIANAQAATAFLNGTGANPYSSLSRDALTSIVYNESGEYTLNQRSAALGQQENNDTAYITEATNVSYATGDTRYLDGALLQLNQHLSPVETAVSDKLLLLTTPTAQLVTQLNEADSEHGGALITNLPYPGGWTST
jgi:glucan-binding YG repeat protein